jgi:hypothetical protein
MSVDYAWNRSKQMNESSSMGPFRMLSKGVLSWFDSTESFMSKLGSNTLFHPSVNTTFTVVSTSTGSLFS